MGCPFPAQEHPAGVGIPQARDPPLPAEHPCIRDWAINCYVPSAEEH